MNWENVLGGEHCLYSSHVLKIDFRFLLDQGPQCDRFAQLTLLTADGWRILKEVQYNDYDRRWTPNKEHAVLALKAYAAFLYAHEEYPAAYLAFQSEFDKSKQGLGEHQIYDCSLPDPDMSGSMFQAAVVELANAEFFATEVQPGKPGELIFGPRCSGTIGNETIKAFHKAQSYLTVLLHLPVETPWDKVWQAYCQARAKKLGLPQDISEEELRRAEFTNPDKRLTIRQMLDCYQDYVRLQLRNEKK